MPSMNFFLSSKSKQTILNLSYSLPCVSLWYHYPRLQLWSTQLILIHFFKNMTCILSYVYLPHYPSLYHTIYSLENLDHLNYGVSTVWILLTTYSWCRLTCSSTLPANWQLYSEAWKTLRFNPFGCMIFHQEAHDIWFSWVSNVRCHYHSMPGSIKSRGLQNNDSLILSFHSHLLGGKKFRKGLPSSTTWLSSDLFI